MSVSVSRGVHPALYPASAARDVSGELRVGGVAVGELAARFGTPLFVVDEQHVRDQAAEIALAFREAFAAVGTAAHVYYAGKAFLCADLARWVVDAGLGIDVCSAGELAVALAAGVDAGRIGLHGNNKSVAEIAMAVQAGVGTIVLDSLIEIERVAAEAARLGRVQRVRLRVNSGVHASTHSFLATAHEDQKFGLPLSAGVDAVARIRAHGSLEFVGLHCHIGSQIFATQGFRESAKRLLGLHRELLAGGPVPELNLGGGFGVAYVPDDEPPRIAEFAQQVAAIVRETCDELGVPLPLVAFEPGRAVVAQSTLTLYSVGTVKPVPLADGRTRTYVSVDGGMSDNARPALYEAHYSADVVGRASTVDGVLSRVVGKHCESGDIVVYECALPGDTRPGDLLAVPVTGAYCWALSSNYNLVGRPPVVAVRDGVARLLLRGEGMPELLGRDCGIPADAVARVSALASGTERPPGGLARSDASARVDTKGTAS